MNIPHLLKNESSTRRKLGSIRNAAKRAELAQEIDSAERRKKTAKEKIQRKEQEIDDLNKRWNLMPSLTDASVSQLEQMTTYEQYQEFDRILREHSNPTGGIEEYLSDFAKIVGLENDLVCL